MSQPRTRPLSPTAWWVLFCVFCNCAGWALSAFHQLNAGGYAVAFGLGLAGLMWWHKQLLPTKLTLRPLTRLRRRFARPLPLGFLVLAGLAILGGLLYRPTNPDALTQRIPRVLNWLAEARWHWIDQAPPSFNSRPCSFEWMLAPMLALLKTDRWIFLYNGISFLLMPGLVFSVLTRLGVRRRVAWCWMWVVPSGYCFLLQAGGLCNDAIGAVFALAAIHFALRARTSLACTDVWLSMLALALVTGVKASSLPLALPWLIAVWPSLRLAWTRPVATAGVAVAAFAASFFAIGALNQYYVHDWTGASYEMSAEMSGADPAVALAGNALNLTAQNLVPPVFPLAGWWNRHAYQFLPKGLLAKMERSFEPRGAHIGLSELQFEASAPLGFGVSLLLVVSCLAVWFSRGQPTRTLSPPPAARWHLALVRWSAWLCLLVYMVKLCLSDSGRILAPYYALLLPSLLVAAGHERLVRRTWWKACAFGVLLLALLLVVLSPGRPLWPAQSTLKLLAGRFPHSSLVKRAQMTYDANATRWDTLGEVRNQIPSTEKEVGLICFLHTSTFEASLWRPFGKRRIRWLGPDETLEAISAKGIRYVAIGVDSPSVGKANVPFKVWFQDWLESHHGTVIAQVQARLLATQDLVPWYVVKLSAAPAQHQAAVRPETLNHLAAR